MATIKHVEEFKKENGKKGWKFTMDDGVVGYLSNDKPWTYKEGEQGTYTVEDKGTYKLITFTRGGATNTPSPTPTPSTPQKQELKEGEVFLPSTKGVERAKTLEEMRFESRVHCLKLAVRCYLGRGIEYTQVKQYFTDWVALMDTAIDELKTK